MLASTIILMTALALTDPAPGAGEELREALPSLRGEWSGVLEYRDYRTNERVTLPHTRSVQVPPGADYVMSALEFTDPGYVVYSAEVFVLDGETVSVGYTSSDGIDTDRLQLISFSGVGGRWQAELTGETRDNGRDAEARYTYEVSEDTLNIIKAVRYSPDEDYVFRNGVRLQRVDAAQGEMQ